MILIAGIGNIFFGDDAFGSELARRLQSREWPEDVRVVDFGIRGIDLLYALMETDDAAVLIDAVPRGGSPGTLYLIEPDLSQEASETAIETHSLDPLQVLSAARQMGAAPRRVFVLGCEPEALDGMGLSDAAGRALEEALPMIDDLLHRIRTEKEIYEPGKTH